MKRTDDTFSRMSLAEQIISFNRNYGEFSKTEENSFFYSMILNNLLLRLYNIIISRRIASLEDVSGLILSMASIIPNLVHSCRAVNDNELDAYLASAALTRKRSMDAREKRNQHREQLILTTHVAYEYILDNNEKAEDCFNEIDEPESDRKKELDSQDKMLFIFTKIQKTRIRFFVYLLSQGRALSDTVVETICKQFDYDIGETLYIIRHLRILSGDSKEKKYLYNEELRNSRWEKLLAAENDASVYHYLCDSEKSSDYSQLAEKRRDNRSKYSVLRMPCSISPFLIASLLDISRSTVYAYVIQSRIITMWCYDSSSVSDEDLASVKLPRDVIQSIKSGRYISELKALRSSGQMKKMYPFDEFGLSFQ